MSYDISVHISVIYQVYDTNLFSNTTHGVILSSGCIASSQASNTHNDSESLHLCQFCGDYFLKSYTVLKSALVYDKNK